MALTYRHDIDGLRAVAVLPVVLFHVGLETVSGGFVGVDVFFVISGYLITSIIVSELRDNRFSLITFYERRIRRIFPALLVMIGTVLVLGPLLFMPDDLRNAAKSAVAATLFSSNFLFFMEAGYFDAAAFTKPLLHTWSLAIEEQFYIVVPLLLMLLARGRGRFGLWIGGLTVASLLLSVLTTAQLPTAAYYLLPWRAWELGIGALLALGVVPALTHRGIREAAALLGLGAILVTAVLLDKSTPFPGAIALVPVLGTALVLHAGAAGPSLVSRVLSLGPFVWIGKLSYSLYLWHWPVIVFFVYWKMDMPSGIEIPALIGLSLLLAWLSWRFVERPFRQPAGGARRGWVFAGAGVAMAVMILGGTGTHLARGFPERLPAEAQRILEFSQDREPRFLACHREKNKANDWSEPCLYGDSTAPARMALWGDSTAAALVPALDGPGKAHGVGVMLFSRDGCPGVQGFELHQFNDGYQCSDFLRHSFGVLLEDPEIETVVMTLRADLYVYGWTQYGFGERTRPPLQVGPESGPLPEDPAVRQAFLISGLEESIKALRAAGKSVVLVYPTPVSGNTVPTSLARFMLRGGAPEDLVVPREFFDARTADIMPEYDRLVTTYDLTAIKMHEDLCDTTGCQLIRAGVPVFYDRAHLTQTVAVSFAPTFAPLFQALNGKRLE